MLVGAGQGGSGPNIRVNRSQVLDSHKVPVGTKVRVREGYNKPELRGMVGTVHQSWGGPYYHYTAVLVRFEDGWYELLWNQEVEKAEESAKA